MKAINFQNLDELHTALGKTCEVSFNVVGFPPENLIGILTKIEFNTQNSSLRVVLQINDTSIAIPLKHVSSFKMEE